MELRQLFTDANHFYCCVIHERAINQVVLKEDSSPQDMLKSLFHVNYLYWLEKNAGILATNPGRDCRVGGRLRMSLEYVQREFNHARDDAESAGWVTVGLIARPLPNRIRQVHVPSEVTVW